MRCSYRCNMWCNCKKPAKPYPPTTPSISAPDVESLELTPNSGQDITFTYTPTDAELNISITSSDTNVVQIFPLVYENGGAHFNAMGVNGGNATVTIVNNDKTEETYTVAITVTEPTPPEPFEPLNSIYVITDTPGEAVNTRGMTKAGASGNHYEARVFATDEYSPNYVSVVWDSGQTAQVGGYYGNADNEYTRGLFYQGVIDVIAEEVERLDDSGELGDGEAKFADSTWSEMADYFNSEYSDEAAASLREVIVTGDPIEPVEPEPCPVVLTGFSVDGEPIQEYEVILGDTGTVDLEYSYDCSNPDFSHIDASTNSEEVISISVDAEGAAINISGIAEGSDTIIANDSWGNSYSLNVVVTAPIDPCDEDPCSDPSCPNYDPCECEGGCISIAWFDGPDENDGQVTVYFKGIPAEMPIIADICDAENGFPCASMEVIYDYEYSADVNHYAQGVVPYAGTFFIQLRDEASSFVANSDDFSFDGHQSCDITLNGFTLDGEPVSEYELSVGDEGTVDLDISYDCANPDFSGLFVVNGDVGILDVTDGQTCVSFVGLAVGSTTITVTDVFQNEYVLNVTVTPNCEDPCSDPSCPEYNECECEEHPECANATIVEVDTSDISLTPEDFEVYIPFSTACVCTALESLDWSIVSSEVNRVSCEVLDAFNPENPHTIHIWAVGGDCDETVTLNDGANEYVWNVNVSGYSCDTTITSIDDIAEIHIDPREAETEAYNIFFETDCPNIEAEDYSNWTVTSSDESIATAYLATEYAPEDHRICVNNAYLGNGECTITVSDGVNEYTYPVVVTGNPELVTGVSFPEADNPYDAYFVEHNASFDGTYSTFMTMMEIEPNVDDPYNSLSLGYGENGEAWISQEEGEGAVYLCGRFEGVDFTVDVSNSNGDYLATLVVGKSDFAVPYEISFTYGAQENTGEVGISYDIDYGSLRGAIGAWIQPEEEFNAGSALVVDSENGVEYEVEWQPNEDGGEGTPSGWLSLTVPSEQEAAGTVTEDVVRLRTARNLPDLGPDDNFAVLNVTIKWEEPSEGPFWMPWKAGYLTEISTPDWGIIDDGGIKLRLNSEDPLYESIINMEETPEFSWGNPETQADIFLGQPENDGEYVPLHIRTSNIVDDTLTITYSDGRSQTMPVIGHINRAQDIYNAFISQYNIQELYNASSDSGTADGVTITLDGELADYVWVHRNEGEDNFLYLEVIINSYDYYYYSFYFENGQYTGHGYLDSCSVNFGE